MNKPRVSLYERLPEIYRIRDLEQSPPGQLRQYLELVEEAFEHIHKNIEALYNDLFIETCDDWVVPYIGDLLGTSHLKGDAWTTRVDVADTIALRRRKGTIAGIERLVFNLTRWGVHCAELRENLVWNQHLNHQRPDAGGVPPYGMSTVNLHTPVRGGTVTLRDPAMLSLLGTPFDPFAHIADLKPPNANGIRYNLSNLAIFLWRLQDYRVRCSRPVFEETVHDSGVFIVRFTIDPLGRPVRLFNARQYDTDIQLSRVTELDGTPSPIPTARLTQHSEAGHPERYFAIDTYDPGDLDLNALEIRDVGLQFHIPATGVFEGEDWPSEATSMWTIFGANLCAWDEGLLTPVGIGDIHIDPVIGRALIGVGSQELADALEESLLVTYTYGAVGPVGAHPVSRPDLSGSWKSEGAEIRHVVNVTGSELAEALSGLQDEVNPVVIQIDDSSVYLLDLNDIDGIIDEDGPTLQLNQPLLIRAADNQRPIIRLQQSLRFCPVDGVNAAQLNLCIEGVFLTRSEVFTGPLISKAILNKLEIVDSTLDPGGFRELDGTRDGSRAPVFPSVYLQEEHDCDQTPEIVVQRSITGPLLIDGGYLLKLKESIVDAGKSVNGADDAPFFGSGSGESDGSGEHYAVSGASDSEEGWGPSTEIEHVTVFGRMRVESITDIAVGGIWVDSLQVQFNQKGCIKFSYFSGNNDRLPAHPACMSAEEAALHFVSERFGEPAYGQLAHTSDFRIRERGPDDDAMGAFGFQKEAHKWRNLQIRFREFMPVGVRPLIITVT